MLNEIDYDPSLAWYDGGEISNDQQCIEPINTNPLPVACYGCQFVSIMDSGRYTYTMLVDTTLYPGPKAFFRLYTELPLDRTSTIRTVEFYDAQGRLLDSRDYSNVAAKSDKRVPDGSGGWVSSPWGNCGYYNAYPTPTPTASP